MKLKYNLCYTISILKRSKHTISNLLTLHIMNIVWFLLVGLIAGWLAGVLVRGRGYGVFADIIIGILGAMVGGFLFGLLGLSARGTLGSIIMAVIGAVVFLAIVKAIHKAT